MSVDTTDELRHVFEQWFASIEERDASFVDRSMHEEFEYIDYEAKVRDKAQYRAMYSMLPPGTKVAHEIREFRERTLAGGASAVATGEYHARIEIPGGPVLEKTLRFVSIWERTAAGWQARVHQTVAVP